MRVSCPEKMDSYKRELKEDMSEKNSKIAEVNRNYSDAFKHQVIDDLLKTGESVSDVAKRYSIGRATLYRWLSIFGVDSPQESALKIMGKNEDELIQEVAELKRQLALSEAKVRQSEISLIFHKKLLERVTREYHIDLKKKIGSK